MSDLSALPSRRVAVAMLLALLLVPLADAHLAGSRPIVQRFQFQRLPDIQPIDGTELVVDLVLSSDQQGQVRDPLRHLVSHRMDPATGLLRVEYREDASLRDEAFYAQWRLERLVEYKDMNFNGKFERASDVVVRAWRFEHFDWKRFDIQNVMLEDVQGSSTIWQGNLTGAPSMRLQVAFAGKDFADEGAVVRAQDVILYFDITNIPPRGVGSLYALEFEVTVQPGTVLGFHTVNETHTALIADAELRRALLVWGGEAYLDGREQRVAATIEDERIDDLGNKTARLVLHLPTVDRSMRFVMVSGLEYGFETLRSPIPLAPWVAAAAIAMALLCARRRP